MTWFLFANYLPFSKDREKIFVAQKQYWQQKSYIDTPVFTDNSITAVCQTLIDEVQTIREQ